MTIEERFEKIEKRYLMRALAALFVLGLALPASSWLAQAADDYNSTRSNTHVAIAPVHVDPDKLRRVGAEIDRQMRQGVLISEKGIEGILRKHGVKAIKKIVIERRPGHVTVFLLDKPGDMGSARKALVAKKFYRPVPDSELDRPAVRY